MKKLFPHLLLCFLFIEAETVWGDEPSLIKEIPALTLAHSFEDEIILKTQADRGLMKLHELQTLTKKPLSKNDKKLIKQQIEKLVQHQQELPQQIAQTVQGNINDYYDTAVAIDTFVNTCYPLENNEAHRACVLYCIPFNIDTKANKCINYCDEFHSCKTKVNTGSGVFLSKSSVLTAYHVMKTKITGSTSSKANGWKKAYYIKTIIRNRYGDQVFVKKVKLYDPENDLALLELTRPIFRAGIPSHGTLSQVQQGDPVFSINRQWSVLVGHVTDKQEKETCVSCIKHSIFSIPGDSGSPVFSQTGQLIGVISNRVITWGRNFNPIDIITDSFKFTGIKFIGSVGPDITRIHKLLHFHNANRSAVSMPVEEDIEW